MKTILWTIAIVTVAAGLGKCLSSPVQVEMDKQVQAWESVR